MSILPAPTRSFLGDRIQWIAILLVACFVSVLLLKSQSRASYPTYALALLMLATFSLWRDVLKSNLLRWVIALLSWLSLSVLWSEQFVLREALSVWTRALLVFCFVVAFAECLQRGQLQRWMGWALTIVGAFAVLAAIANFFVSNPEDGRLNGLGQLDTHVIAALVYGVVLIFVIRTARIPHPLPLRGLVLAVGAMVIFAVFLSDSRNAWVSVTLGVLVYLFAFRCTDSKQFVITVVSMGLVVSIIIALLATNDAVADVLFPRGDSFRFTIWSSTLDRIASDSFLFGRGILTTDNITVGGITFTHPHNMYLALVHQGGLIALALFLVVVFKSLKLLLYFYEDHDAKFSLGILAMALSAYVLDGHELVDKVGDTWFLIWLPVAVAVGISWRNLFVVR